MNQIISSLLISSSLFSPFNNDNKNEIPINNYLPIEIVNVDIYNKLKEKKELEILEKLQVEKILEERKIKKLEEDKLIKLKEEELKWKTFNATHYSPFCPTGCIGITATGYNVKNTIYYNGMRVIAVDPKYIPLGSIVEVKYPYGNFKAVALDTGGAIKGYKIDILVKKESIAYELGKFDVKIKIIGKIKK